MPHGPMNERRAKALAQAPAARDTSKPIVDAGPISPTGPVDPPKISKFFKKKSKKKSSKKKSSDA